MSNRVFVPIDPLPYNMFTLKFLSLFSSIFTEKITFSRKFKIYNYNFLNNLWYLFIDYTIELKNIGVDVQIYTRHFINTKPDIP